MKLPLFSEYDRVAAVHGLDVALEVSDATLDHVVEIAARLFSVPICLVSLVEATRQIFPARVGLAACETTRDVSFCSHAVAQRSLLVVPDARTDTRFVDNPLVTGAPGVRFYAGAPMVTRSGHAVGALCIIDTEARDGLPSDQARLLTGLADLAIAHMERRRLSFANRTAMRLAAATSDAFITADHSGSITFWNEAAEHIFGYARAEAIGAPLDLIIPTAQRAAHRSGLRRVSEGGAAKVDGVVDLQARRRDGAIIPVEMSLAHWRDEGGMQFAAVVRDVSERRREQAELQQLTHVDALTGLPNRVAFLQAIDGFVRNGARCSILKIGLDEFKSVNESHGLPTGDALLRQAGQRIVLVAGGGAMTARLGGDEFGVLLKKTDDPLNAALVAERIIAALSAPFVLESTEPRLTASVGLVLSPGLARPETAHEALKQALLALQAAKALGGGQQQVFSIGMSRQADERQKLLEELRNAVADSQFEVHYQPQVSLRDGAVVGVEALLRWRHPHRGLLSPGDFLLTLERSELSLGVGRWILEEACRFGGTMAAQGKPLRVGVNLFASHLRSPTFERDVREALSSGGLQPTQLELEITETTVLGADEAMTAALHRLRQMGVGVAFDDYGTGYASLSMLKRYPVSRLKIDREFVTDVEIDGADTSIVRAVLALGESLGLEVIAEGVETAAQAVRLHRMGCREAQGFLFGRASPGDTFITGTQTAFESSISPLLAIA